MDPLTQTPAGNAFDDGEHWDALYTIAFDLTAPLARRAAAVRKMDELTGCSESAGFDDDQTLVDDFLAGMLRDCGVTPENFDRHTP